jgi:hypothetical protein
MSGKAVACAVCGHFVVESASMASLLQPILFPSVESCNDKVTNSSTASCQLSSVKVSSLSTLYDAASKAE